MAKKSMSCRDSYRRFNSVYRGLLLLMALASLAGCGGKPLRPAPPTYTVSGEVKSAGVRLPAGAQIEFRPIRDTQVDALTARGVIDSSGKFQLNIPFVDRVLLGATEGPHTVRIVFSAANNPTTEYGAGLIIVPEKFTVEPKENHFTITLPKP
jgi:hypothetical protein